jgi:hypothetical protein
MPQRETYRLDKTVFRAQTAAEADNHIAYWLTKTAQERMAAACYLINQLYGATPQTPLNRTVFSKRKHPA